MPNECHRLSKIKTILIVNETLMNENLIHRLAEVGKLSMPKAHEKYETGQFFLHRVFGYRGVILFPWRAKIYDRNTHPSSYTDSSTDDNTSINSNEADTTSINAVSDDTASTTAAGLKQSNRSTSKIETIEADSIRSDGKKEITVDVQTYYQVLIDSRDCPHVVCLSRFMISGGKILINLYFIITEGSNRSGHLFE